MQQIALGYQWTSALAVSAFRGLASAWWDRDDCGVLDSTTDQPGDTQSAKRLGGITGKGFLPGKSGNPAGLSRALKNTAVRLRNIAVSLTEEGLYEAAAIMRNKRETTANRMRAIELLVRCGHADRLPEVAEVGDITYIVQQMVVDVQPVAGVLSSPVKGHVAPARIAAPRGEVIDA